MNKTPLPPKPAGQWMAIVMAGMLCAVIVLLLTLPFSNDVFEGLFLDGSIAIVWTLAAWGIGQFLADRLTAGAHPLLRTTTAIALGLGLAGLLILGCGLMGILSRAILIGWIAMGCIAWLWKYRSGYVQTRTWLEKPDISMWLLAIPFAVLGVSLTVASICPALAWKPLDPSPYDVTSYHFQIVREWFENGQITGLKHNSFSYFPFGMEMHFLAAMYLRRGPWDGMYLAQFMTVIHACLTVFAIAGTVLDRRRDQLSAWVSVIAICTVPWFLMLSCVGYVECAVMLYTTLAIAWGMRWLKDGTLTSAMVCGALAGLACGMKYTAIVMTAVPLLGGLMLLVLLRRVLPSSVSTPIKSQSHGDTERITGNAQPSMGREIQSWVVLVITCALFASPWLIRNVIWTRGNPVFPLATGVFGKGHFTDDQVDRYQKAHRFVEGDRSIITRVKSAFNSTFLDQQYGYILLPLGVIAVGWVVIRSNRRDELLIPLMLIAMTVVWLGLTHVIPRFYTPAIPIIAISIGLLPASWVRVTLPVLAVVFVWNAFCFIPILNPITNLGQMGAYRLADPDIIQMEGFKEMKASGLKLALIGDAQAFFFSLPSDRIEYRSIFDVTIPPGTNTIDGWLGKPLAELRRDHWVIINGSELTRLASTYAHVPQPPAPYNQLGMLPVLLPPTH